jgi:hypothetical protein
MDWDAIGAIGEVVGAAGVIFSLIYLGTQIRSSTRQANADAIYNFQKAQADVMDSFSSQPDIARLFAKLEGSQPLEDHENIQIDFIVARVTGIFAAAQASADNGIIGPQYLDDAASALGIFATRFHLADRMWRYLKRAHGSVKDGRTFNVLRSASEPTTSASGV